MPFLHGFRRIIYEYQPLVDAVMCVVGVEERGGGGRQENRWVQPQVLLETVFMFLCGVCHTLCETY